MKLVTIAAVVAVLTSCATQRGFPPEHQIVNFDKVDTVLYRGAQPTHNGYEFLKSVGIKSVVNLRMGDDVLPDEQAVAGQLGITYTNMPMNGLKPPTVARMNQILDTIEKLPGPVFIHCQFGCDRTGAVAACWRIRHGWSAAKAYKEAKAYGISVFQPGLRKFIRDYEK